MAPLSEKSFTKNKCLQENRDSKQKLFSFRWLLKRSKSSKFAKEMTQAENSQPVTVVTSKSCDAALTSFEAIDKCPTFFLWKLLPPPGKSLTHSRSSNVCAVSEKSSFKTSFSCNDVYNMVSTDNMFDSIERNHGLSPLYENQTSESRYPSHSCYRLNKLATNSNYFDTLVASADVKPQTISTNPAHNVLCKLCLSMVPASKMYTLQDCFCVFCVPCLKQYLTINVKEGNVTVTCPDADCSSSGKILVSEIQDIAGEEAYLTFERFKLNRDVELDPKRVWCPAPGCETICSFQPPTNPSLGVSVCCLNCKTKFCSSCKLRSHKGKMCDEVRRALSDEIEFSISDDESSIKRCPNCRVPIEKDDGCAQMMCYRCKHVFCWHCLASLDDDFLLRHYDKGPCRNKLGHSRASMIWHRTQVVGIFAGFSFLLLMASPFLLLAAPCLLCCRCKHKFFYEEATPL